MLHGYAGVSLIDCLDFCKISVLNRVFVVVVAEDV